MKCPPIFQSIQRKLEDMVPDTITATLVFGVGSILVKTPLKPSTTFGAVAMVVHHLVEPIFKELLPAQSDKILSIGSAGLCFTADIVVATVAASAGFGYIFTTYAAFQLILAAFCVYSVFDVIASMEEGIPSLT